MPLENSNITRTYARTPWLLLELGKAQLGTRLRAPRYRLGEGCLLFTGKQSKEGLCPLSLGSKTVNAAYSESYY